MSYTIKIASEGVAYFELDEGGTPHANLDDFEALKRMAHPLTGFREFLNHWYFKPPGSEPKVLGLGLWEAQEEFVAWTATDWWLYFLKARQLGESTIECAYDGWVMRFRDLNARVHIFSKREDAAQELLSGVKFGLENLPEWLQLPVVRETLNEYVIGAPLGPEEKADERMAKAYPADNDTARGAACTHAHVDEWAFMGNPSKVWQSIEPSAHGSCHILTTGDGPENFTSGYYRKCQDGTARHKAVFIGALKRPGRDDKWLRDKRASLGDERLALREYPMTVEDALSGGGDYVFTTAEIDAAGEDCRGLGVARKGRKYSKGWDIGRHQDAAVGVVLDVTEDVHDVVEFIRLRGVSYPEIQRRIEETHRRYPGPLGVEKNAAGEAVLENLNLSEETIDDAKFTTSKSSKARIISQLKLQLQRWQLKWDPRACEQLDTEMRGYQSPDENVVQDSVIALAIAEEYAPKAHAGARSLGVFSA